VDFPPNEFSSLSHLIIIMLDQLSADTFSPYIGKTCRLTAQGYVFALTIETVTEHIRSKPPEASRIPFYVLLSGPQEPGFHYGTFTLTILDTDMVLSGVYIERTTTPIDMDTSRAYYQLIFN
jgi:hypothetical protein